MINEPQYLVITKDYKDMNGFYDNNIVDGVLYLGYTSEKEIALGYIDQFRNKKNIFYIKVSREYIEKLMTDHQLTLSIIILIDGEIEITSDEADYMQEFESGWEYVDILNALDASKKLLGLYKNKELKRIRKEIMKAINMFTDDYDDLSSQIDEGKYWKHLLIKHGMRR